MVVYGLMLIECLFHGVLALVWTILIVRRVFKVLTIGSTMLAELVFVISMSSVSRVSNNYYIDISKSMESWCLCGLRSKFYSKFQKKSCSIGFVFSFGSFMVYSPVRFLLWTVLSFNRYILLLS